MASREQRHNWREISNAAGCADRITRPAFHKADSRDRCRTCLAVMQDNLVNPRTPTDPTQRRKPSRTTVFHKAEDYVRRPDRKPNYELQL
jgi:hypothetical protein